MKSNIHGNVKTFFPTIVQRGKTLSIHGILETILNHETLYHGYLAFVPDFFILYHFCVSVYHLCILYYLSKYIKNEVLLTELNSILEYIKLCHVFLQIETLNNTLYTKCACCIKLTQV